MVMNDITERELVPLWPGVLFLGKPTLFAGDPGVGKSLVTLDIAARVSTGACWPCSCEPQTPGDVAILSAEDDAADVMKPRLRNAGADMERILVIGHVEEVQAGNGHIRRRALQLDQDIEALKCALLAHPRPIKLLIVDPLGAYMGSADTHNNAEVRAVLAQLAELAAELRMAVLVIQHLNKGDTGNALYKVSGSLAFVAAARAVYLIEKDPKNEQRILMLVAKSNYGPTTRNFAFSKSGSDDGHGVVRWEDEPIKFSADMILGSRMSPRDVAKAADVERAVAWLHGELLEGERLANDVKAAATAAGIAERDLRAAADRMRVLKTQKRFHGPFSWALPPHSYS